MAKRRAGDWARRRVALRRRQLVREHWRPFLAALVTILAISAVAVVVAAVLVGAWLAWFIVGGVYAGILALWLTIFELVDPVSRRFARGADGEEHTARELGRCSRQGWRCVHNVVLESGDIDHMVVGPGGVMAIETKRPDAGWGWLQGQDVHLRWVRQASRAAMKTRALIRQHRGLQVEVRPVVVVWARGLAGERVEVDGVRVLHGTDLAGFLDGLAPALDREQVRQIHSALEPVAIRLEAVLGARRDALARG